MKVVKWLLWIGSGLLLIGLIGAWLTVPDIQPSHPNEIDMQKSYLLDGVQVFRLKSEYGDLKVESSEDERAKLIIKGSSYSSENEVLKEVISDGNIELQILTDRFHQSPAFSGLWGLVYDRLKHGQSLATEQTTTLVLPRNPAFQLLIDHEYGDVEVKDVKVMKLSIENDYGDTIVHESTGEMEFDSQYGDVQIDLKEPDTPITCRNEYGDIRVNYPNAPSNVLIDGTSQYGDVTIFDHEKQSVRFGDGKIQVKLETKNGDVEVSE